MTKIKHPQLIADIEPSIALRNALAIEREHSIPMTKPSSQSAHRDAPTARASYLRELVARVFSVLTTGGLDDLATAHSSSHAGRPAGSGAKSA
jgi:hypothetical protein